jgi:IS605 OrfB family transposase
MGFNTGILPVIRAVKFPLSTLTKAKRAAVGAVLREYHAAINFYCQSIWTVPGRLDAKTLKRYTGGSLGYRQRSDCLSMALSTVITTKKASKATGKRCTLPHSAKGVRISELCAKVETFKGEGFDYAVKLSGLVKGSPIIIPLKAHRVVHKWLAKDGAHLKNGCVLGADYIMLYIEIPEAPEKTIGADLGLDTGYRKLAATSDGSFLGANFKDICRAVKQKKPGSNGKARSKAARSQYINRELKKIPWGTIRRIAVEDLTGLKLRTQTKEKSSKQSRKTMAPWTYRQVLTRIEQLAQEHRVRLVYVDPRNTSRRCPACGLVAKENRVREDFCCIGCNYSADADFVGATNILARMTGNWQDDMVPASSDGQLKTVPGLNVPV